MENKIKMICITLFITLLCAIPYGVASETKSYVYDEASRLVQVNNGNGTSITYTYDDAGNLLERKIESSSDGNDTDPNTPDFDDTDDNTGDGGSGGGGCFISNSF